MSLRAGSARVQGGLLAGGVAADGAVAFFKGVPYARPPVGPLRWRPPEPAASWSGVRPATAFGPRAIQPDRPALSISYFGPESESEDCLYLNVWTGAASPDERRPVMVWFHGGAYQVGSGTLPIFDGEALARRGAIVVTVNYRLGALGFLAHPGLSRESPLRVSGNYGLLDQIAALAWVRGNIAAFGGDCDRVTIFGQSVGATSVCCLMASPLARGLFHRAIGQSGAALAPPGRVGGGSLPSLAQAEARGLVWAEAFGDGSIAALRAASARDIQLRVRDQRLARGAPLYGDNVLPETPHDVFLKGGQSRVPLLTGSNADEGSTRPAAATLDAFLAEVAVDLGGSAGELAALYLREAHGDIAEASRRLGGDRCFGWQNWTWARLHVRAGAPVYYYHFSQPSPLPPGRPWHENDADKLGAFHTAEIPYVFANLSRRDWAWRDGDRDLAEIMAGHWTNFAASGDPNGRELPHWQRFDRTRPRVMEFDADAIAMTAVPGRALFDAFDALYARHAPSHRWLAEGKTRRPPAQDAPLGEAAHHPR